MSAPIFYTTSVALDAGGGQTTRVIEHCRVLAAEAPVRLFAPQPPPGLPDLPFTRVPVPARPPRDLGFQVRLARALIREGRRTPPALIYSYAGSLNLGPRLAAWRLGCPLALELHGLHALEYGLEHRRTATLRARQLAYAAMFRLDMLLADGVVAVTDQLAARARAAGARSTLTAPNGVNPRHFLPTDGATARRAEGFADDEVVIGFVGNLAGWQGLDTLLRGLALALPRAPRLRLLLIGTGSQERLLRALAAELGIEERIVWAGRVPYADVPRRLSAADVLAGPFAANERNAATGVSPLKVFEYLALGRPILVSDLPGLEFVAAEGAGGLFRADDPVDLARKLIAFAALPPAARAAYGRRARSLAEERYSWEQISGRILAYAATLAPDGQR
ncbi:MAG TPA: glycosyltransferase [Herpetosiphonaceae bacterium]